MSKEIIITMKLMNRLKRILSINHNLFIILKKNYKMWLDNMYKRWEQIFLKMKKVQYILKRIKKKNKLIN